MRGANTLSLKTWEIRIRHCVTEVHPSLLQRGARFVLWILSGGYWAGLHLHQMIYRIGIKKKKRAPLWTISVGNIVCGGSGKTPIVAMLAKKLQESSSIALLSRGYRAIDKRSGPWMSEGKGPRIGAKEGGDEPYLLARRLPSALVLVGKKRLPLLNLAAQRGADLAIVDDGFQHYAMSRDSDVVVVGADDPFGQNYFLPRGFLRDSPKRLKEADLIVVHQALEKAHFDAISETIEMFTKAPIVGTCLTKSHCRDSENKEFQLEGKKVAAFCAIARPEAFFQHLKSLRADLIQRLELADHEAIDILKLKQFAKQAYTIGCELLVCTEKDWVKLPDIDYLPLPLTYLSIEADVVYNRELFENWLTRAKNKGRL